ncbi:hypothetical protein CUMW_212430 [Citrus unshiu]|uniref:Uncharacterized protein n=1 Tax=Citrus unshiu TaxID=55188 RepID=A0A2H5QAT7_CITUN|nr:hypothetical protein CUMW_212430 [Citrus unshiu]
MRSLLNGETYSLKYMPIGISKLTSLRTLDKFVVGGGVDGSNTCRLESLKNLQLLRECGIEGLGNVSHLDEAERLQLYNKKNLLRLRLVFGGVVDFEYFMVKMTSTAKGLLNVLLVDFEDSMENIGVTKDYHCGYCATFGCWTLKKEVMAGNNFISCISWVHHDHGFEKAFVVKLQSLYNGCEKAHSIRNSFPSVSIGFSTNRNRNLGKSFTSCGDTDAAPNFAKHLVVKDTKQLIKANVRMKIVHRTWPSVIFKGTKISTTFSRRGRQQFFKSTCGCKKIDGHQIILSLEALRSSTKGNRAKGNEDSRRCSEYNKRDDQMLLKACSFCYNCIGLGLGNCQNFQKKMEFLKPNLRRYLTFPTWSQRTVSNGFDRVVTWHFDVVGVALFLSTALRTLEIVL